MDALQTDQLDIVKYLLETYDNKTINLFDRDKLNNSTIHLVCQSGSIKCLKFIFYKYFNQTNLFSELKTNLNCFNMTPLHSACKNNKETILVYILNELNNIHYITDLIKQQDIHNRSAYDIALSMSINQTNNKNNCLIILNKFY
jgi:ankyrin repeat protein